MTLRGEVGDISSFSGSRRKINQAASILDRHRTCAFSPGHDGEEACICLPLGAPF